MRLTVRCCVAAVALFGASAAFAAPIPIPPEHDADIRWYGAAGVRISGSEAFRRLPQVDLDVWLAGNQFFAMDRIVGDFQKSHPGLSVGLITLPPGLILKAIQGGGWTYGDQSLTIRPDVYGSVSLAHLRETKLIDSYVTYMHNALQLMVAPGNPKHIRDLHDLARPDLRVMLPNPVSEGIMSEYAKPVLQRLQLWDALSGGRDCSACDPTPRVHFTVVHHREIPAAIVAGKTDVGIVWQTETQAALARGERVSGLPLPKDQSAIDEVAYVAGRLRDSPHRDAADAYIAFIASPAGQAGYESFGFLPATIAERTLAKLAP